MFVLLRFSIIFAKPAVYILACIYFCIFVYYIVLYYTVVLIIHELLSNYCSMNERNIVHVSYH